jgi:hypothetical protein
VKESDRIARLEKEVEALRGILVKFFPGVEFPDGKVKANESPIRTLREEIENIRKIREAWARATAPNATAADRRALRELDGFVPNTRLLKI